MLKQCGFRKLKQTDGWLFSSDYNMITWEHKVQKLHLASHCHHADQIPRQEDRHTNTWHSTKPQPFCACSHHKTCLQDQTIEHYHGCVFKWTPCSSDWTWPLVVLSKLTSARGTSLLDFSSILVIICRQRGRQHWNMSKFGTVLHKSALRT